MTLLLIKSIAESQYCICVKSSQLNFRLSLAKKFVSSEKKLEG
ncbi:hypothetical protein EV05_1396 [Prochlorococcus sp. MIT 0601]|nr:hypothetical protein EV05_1396 [Prochlorococcus sp. MIT 0601]